MITNDGPADAIAFGWPVFGFVCADRRVERVALNRLGRPAFLGCFSSDNRTNHGLESVHFVIK